jgi:L-lactate permease
MLIAFFTLVAMIALTCAQSWGHGWGVFAYVLWWIGAFLTTISTTAIPFMM